MSGPNDVEVRLGAETGDLEQGMRQGADAVSSSVRKMQGDINASLGAMHGTIDKVVSSLKGMFGALIGIGAVTQITRSVIQTTQEFESLEIMLRSVMGTAEKGDAAFAWIKQFAVDTPYSVESTTRAFMQLKNFGLDPMDGTLRKVADASAKYGRDAYAAERVTLALGQAWARSKLQGQDILQLIDAGIPVWDLLNKATGKTTGELQKMSERGELTRDVMRKLIDEMGKSADGTAELKMKSLAGAISNMGDAYANAIDDVRKEGGFQFLTDSVLSFTDAVPTIVQTVYGMGREISAVISELWNTAVDAFSAIKKAITDALGVDSEPMTAMEFFKNALKVLHVTVIGFRTGFETVFTSLKVSLSYAASAFTMFGEVAGRALKLDWAGAKAAYRAGVEETKRIAAQGAADLVEIALQGRQRMDEVLLGKPVAAPPPADANSGADGKPAPKPEMTDAQRKDAETAITFARDKARALIDIERDAITQRRKLNEIDAAEEARLREALLVRQYEADRAALEAKVKLYAKDKAAKQGALNDIALLELKHSQDVAKLRAAAALEAAKTERQTAEQTAEHVSRLAQMDVDARRDALALKRDLGMISAKEELAELRNLADEQYRIELDLLEKKLELYQLDTEARTRIERQIVEMKARQAKDIARIDADMQRDQLQVWQSLGNRIGGLWDKGLQALMNGTLTWRNAIRAVFADLTAWFAQEVIGKKVKAWIMGELLQTQATTVAVSTRTGVEAAGAASSTAITAGTGAKNIMVQAWEAMAGAYKAIAAIPYVGPFMAPAVAAGTFAAVAALAGNVFSAEGGFDIPSGMNPMVQAHQKEMILPAKYADVIRGMAEGGGAQQSSGNITLNITAMDAKGVRDYFKKNSHALTPSLRNLSRNFSR